MSFYYLDITYKYRPSKCIFPKKLTFISRPHFDFVYPWSFLLFRENNVSQFNFKKQTSLTSCLFYTAAPFVAIVLNIKCIQIRNDNFVYFENLEKKFLEIFCDTFKCLQTSEHWKQMHHEQNSTHTWPQKVCEKSQILAQNAKKGNFSKS